MYEASADPYCYPGTDVLENRLGIRDSATLQAFEAAISLQRASEALPNGRFSAAHYRNVHYHLFRDVYRWAGKYRQVGLVKGSSVFCLPENIPPQMDDLFASLRGKGYLRGLSVPAFARQGATFLATLNAIHAFREGNGRAQVSFLSVLASRAGHALFLDRLVPAAFLNAMIASFYGDEVPLEKQLLLLAS